MATLHAFPQSSRLPTQPLRPSPPIERMKSPKDMAPQRSISPTKVSGPVLKHLVNSTSVPSLRQVAAQQSGSSQTLPTQKLKGMAGARQRAKDVWQRRKGSGSELETVMSTVLELDGVDSPTVPNRPTATHSRSDSTTGWRRHAFGTAMISSITPPPRLEDLSIFSPLENCKEGRGTPNSTTYQQATPTDDLPPAVPPKTPPGQGNKDMSFFFERSPSIMDRSPVRSQTEPCTRAQTVHQPARPESPTLREEKNTFRGYRTVSPISRPIPIRPARPASPPKEKPQIVRKPEQQYAMLIDTTRPRPSSPMKKETRSATPLADKRFEEPRKCPERPTPCRPRAESAPLEASKLHKERKEWKEKREERPQLQLNTKTTQQSPLRTPIEPLRTESRATERLALHKRQKSSTSDIWALPSGVRPIQAHAIYGVSEIQSLQLEARKQARKYDVLRSQDVEQLTRELIQLEGRCQYLRNQHRNVRSERKTLHNRMLTYLRSQRNFSQDNLLKQEEALAALDEAIEQWEEKMETTENRRNQVRLKLLEHMTATLTIGSAIDGSLTPPATPEKEAACSPENEMITVYALLADVEHNLGRINR